MCGQYGMSFRNYPVNLPHLVHYTQGSPFSGSHRPSSLRQSLPSRPEKAAPSWSQVLRLEKAGIIRHSLSSWSSPMHMVPKPDGTWQPCGDYRRLNFATKSDKYSLPYFLDLSLSCMDTSIFPSLFWSKATTRSPWRRRTSRRPPSSPPTASKYLFIPFGLTNDAQTFQHLMDRLLRHLPFVFTRKLQQNGLTINPAKCVFVVSSLKFLGHQVSVPGIVPLARHVTAIQEFPPPSDLKSLKRFLGMIIFFRQFLPSIPKVLQHLTDLLRGSPKVLLWSADATAAFTAHSLSHFCPSSFPPRSWSCNFFPCRCLWFTCRRSVAAVPAGWMVPFLKKSVADSGQIRDLRQRTAGGPVCHSTLSVSVGGPPISPPGGSQAAGHRYAPRIATLVRTSAASPLLHSWVHGRHPPHVGCS